MIFGVLNLGQDSISQNEKGISVPVHLYSRPVVVPATRVFNSSSAPRDFEIITPIPLYINAKNRNKNNNVTDTGGERKRAWKVCHIMSRNMKRQSSIHLVVYGSQWVTKKSICNIL